MFSCCNPIKVRTLEYAGVPDDRKENKGKPCMFLDSKGVMLVKPHPYENRKDNHTVDQTSKLVNVSSNVTLGSFMDIQFSVDQ